MEDGKQQDSKQQDGRSQRKILDKDLSIKVLRFLEQNPGMSYRANDLMDLVETDTTQDSVGAALNRLSHLDTSGVVRVQKGVYKYIGVEQAQRLLAQNSKTDNPIFEQIGQTKGGKLLLQGTDDNIYIATPLSDVLD